MPLPKPSCKIDWTYEGYRQVWLHDGTKASPDHLHALCRDLAWAIQDAETFPALQDAIERFAAGRNLRAEVFPGPSHADPARLYVTVGMRPKLT